MGKTKYLASSFSIQMIPEGGVLEIKPVPLEDVQDLAFHEDGGVTHLTDNEGNILPHTSSFFVDPCHKLRDGVKSVVGHEGTAKALSALLKVPVPVNREAIRLQPGDELFVAQPTGQRIKYGEEIDFPELQFFKVSFHTGTHLSEATNDEIAASVRRRKPYEESVPLTCQNCGKPINADTLKIGLKSQREGYCTCDEPLPSAEWY